MVAPADRLSRERPVRRTQATPRAPPGVQASGRCRLQGVHGRYDYPPEAVAIRKSGMSPGEVQATEVVDTQRGLQAQTPEWRPDLAPQPARTIRPSSTSA